MKTAHVDVSRPDFCETSPLHIVHVHMRPEATDDFTAPAAPNLHKQAKLRGKNLCVFEIDGSSRQLKSVNARAAS
jgi:hypothetical protein